MTQNTVYFLCLRLYFGMGPINTHVLLTRLAFTYCAVIPRKPRNTGFAWMNSSSLHTRSHRRLLYSSRHEKTFKVLATILRPLNRKFCNQCLVSDIVCCLYPNWWCLRMWQSLQNNSTPVDPGALTFTMNSHSKMSPFLPDRILSATDSRLATMLL